MRSADRYTRVSNDETVVTQDIGARMAYGQCGVPSHDARVRLVEWVKKQRKVYTALNGRHTVYFCRLNTIDDYNFGMGFVDVYDRLRTLYRPDRFARRQKWWHAIYFERRPAQLRRHLCQNTVRIQSEYRTE